MTYHLVCIATDNLVGEEYCITYFLPDGHHYLVLLNLSISLLLYVFFYAFFPKNKWAERHTHASQNPYLYLDADYVFVFIR